MKLFIVFLIASCAFAQTPYATSMATATVPNEIAINRGSVGALAKSEKIAHARQPHHGHGTSG